jgi:hypothetical protein
MMLEIQVLAWDRHKNVAGLNQLIVSQPSPLDKAIVCTDHDIVLSMFMLSFIFLIYNM